VCSLHEQVPRSRSEEIALTSTPPDPVPPPPPFGESAPELLAGKKPLQFSLRFLFVVMTTVAVMAVLPEVVSQLVVALIHIAATGFLVTGVVFARGDQRAFCIGAAAALLATWSGGGRGLWSVFAYIAGSNPGSSISRSLSPWFDLAILVTVSAANGWFCVWARRYFERSGGR